MKGQSMLIDLWPRVIEAVPGAQLWVVGGGEGQQGLAKRAWAVGVADSVHFTGQVSDAELDRCYRSCDVFAMPSRGEGFGLVFAEAMARGLPCVASRVDAGAEVVEDGRTGLLVDPDDRDEVLAALLRLLHDDGLRRRLGEAGLARARSEFSVQEFRRRLWGILGANRV